ncbi:MAG: hypothetical protein O9297_06095 [Flavobacterium sp.]|uniref:hypothetical protein n=2 Tax=Flavobacterium sp. TaxID=239 RepID=UPI0022BA8FD2|nr:hypothetical protein [Flavobacterium sp.]MCZ8169240.1 hypothetical protein [Flavobacterium sp.]MCZ8296771.1 hypothetical protein [Flavobacterium sp.]
MINEKTLFRLLLLCLLAIGFTTFHHYILDLKVLEINTLSKKISQNQLDKIVNASQSNEYLNYIVVPINIFVKVVITALLLLFGCTLFNVKIHLKKLIRLTITAEFLFLLPILYEITYFKFIESNHSYIYIQNFSSLSFFNLINNIDVEPWLIYPLQTLNLFELAYIIYLSYQIGCISKTNFNTGLKIVGYSYVPALLLWVAVVMFFTLNNS